MKRRLLNPETLRALSDKYRALAGLRRRHDTGAPRGDKGELRLLAERFPGALRELDTLGLAELQRRAESCAHAGRGGPREAWMSWIIAAHRLLAGVITWRKLHGRASRPPSSTATRSTATPAPATRATAARELSRLTGFAFTDAEAAQLLRPPGGRVVPAVLAWVARREGLPPRQIADALFPTRRPSPYEL